jgi:hypothetical protein
LIPKALRKQSYGLYIATSRKGDKLNGQIANTAFQMTAEPSRLNKSRDRYSKMATGQCTLFIPGLTEI